METKRVETGPSPKSWRIGTVIIIVTLSIFALISFIGVGIISWRSAAKNVEIENLRAEVLAGYRKGWDGNPILSNENTSKEYALNLTVHGDNGYLDLEVTDGQVSRCRYVKNDVGGAECGIGGLDGEIYKMAEVFARPNDPETRNLVFIMTDGRALYIPIAEAFATDTWRILGALEVEKPVVDIVAVEITPQASTKRKGFLIVFNDGTFAEFTRGMVDY